MAPCGFPDVTNPILWKVGAYLVEVGGPVLSLLGLSFICVLFVCSVFHCDTALANLPNEPQELNNGRKKKKKRHSAFTITITKGIKFILR